ncbi:methionyl-tRNA formyltransferase [Helicobacter didelphidarum]|uniref:methionyl-tRNA formyltransferase n=1 Tax=Helicobacter didelphidarum TaxID=2040648 RepID=A0A3D8IQ57_9HELI|nr:methionyl-tRNA formyltransferase [Helicobacter didelphidarum]RDU67055.1 methionyl-tRNA formyltransferase [Helicobacter didelphidarum]
MNLVFFGTPPFARDILMELHKQYDILATITQPDKPFGRKKILKMSAVKEYAISVNIECFQPIKSYEIKDILHNIETKHKTKIDAVVVVAYGKILNKEVVENYFCINLHGSLLPYYRGASPVQNSIIDDYQHFGLSVIRMDNGLDSGEILESYALHKDIVYKQTINQVFTTLVPYGKDILCKVLEDFTLNRLCPTPQNHELATYCSKLEKKDAYLDLEDSKACYLRYLALNNIGTWIRYNEETLKINTLVGYDNRSEHKQKGEILEIQKDKILIACKKGELWAESFTPPNKSKMNAISFLQSCKLKVGDILE